MQKLINCTSCFHKNMQKNPDEAVHVFLLIKDDNLLKKYRHILCKSATILKINLMLNQSAMTNIQKQNKTF